MTDMPENVYAQPTDWGGLCYTSVEAHADNKDTIYTRSARLPQGTVIKRVTVGVMRGNNHVSATAGTYAEALEMVTEKLEEYGQ
jgi:hypothetical protein